MQSLKTKHVRFAPLVICWSMMFVSSARDADQFLHTAAILHARGPGHGSRLWHQDILWGEAFEQRFYCTGGKITAVKNREFVNKPACIVVRTGNLWTNLIHIYTCVHAHLQTRTCTWKHACTHTHTHTLLCCCDHHGEVMLNVLRCQLIY